jgi:hypothetical protein
LPVQIVIDLISRPANLLEQHAMGGPQMISRVRDLVASNPAALLAIMSLVSGANRDQKTAIGTGLGQAARICVTTDQNYANEIQQAVVASPDKDLKLAYQSVIGDVATPAAATGAAGGGPGGGVATGAASAGSAPGGSMETFGNIAVNTLSFTYNPSVGGGARSSVTTSTTVISSPAASISP